ncbi:L-glutamine ABC transporter membrane protein /L-glutamate ABC transporter membrane protein /L-aspartate ABC transporter membrane protein /L-asparagine ABC transporter membrane protein [Loktanella fryxellensis]|uniref:L-glutamine ABC transporter membrane protein /L-glutamate ABC transporter membrane protein /L-aspartate ABC transporter membrane protein /L-asparagine ABC transporter membrane protein n=1 Tax=Loktanella fryxellensis TaxID=245187 RepID=A0A1H8A4B3_9RHOB|nr:ABC transporter permease subunit [Loktanella fryxellensis]SEM65722.1 L-glutamine ABC transporter membrane protein /L-glutamate ABC transporter membrane protein /L-aspartate ABC transporter membrane protein /L-asparagine ABC transporter membrane protein [Loktanella fryxellensis]
MSSMTDSPPRESFRLSQLIYDTRYRSLTIQVFTLVLVCIGIYWLGQNLLTNLASLGLQPNFAFLNSRAGYDITPSIGTWITGYTSAATHWDAALVGVYNTLLVAFLGIILATVLGVIAGVLRLSRNWLVSRMMAVYVEGFRNVPLLLWILLIYSIFSEALPQPRDFREVEGAVSAASMTWGAFAATNRGFYMPAPVWGPGSGVLVAVFVASVVAAVLYRRYARKVLFDTGRMLPMLWPMVVIALLPVIAAYFVLGQPVSLSYPELAGFNFSGGLRVDNALLALWLALSLYTGAFITEIVRAGILSVSKGQTEAASALGMRPNRTMNLVILPQAMRVIIPPLTSQYLNLTKNSSLAIAVGYADVRATLGGISLNQTGRALECMLMLGLLYLALSLAISFVMNLFNASMKLKER